MPAFLNARLTRDKDKEMLEKWQHAQQEELTAGGRD